MYYLQVDSSQRCMPVGGPIGYDTFMIYTFISLIGYGENAGHLKTWLRGDDSMIDINFGEDLSALGSSGDGLWGHAKSKLYLLIDTMIELTYMLLLVLISCKVLLHSMARIQTKQMFARHTNFQERGAQNQNQNLN